MGNKPSLLPVGRSVVEVDYGQPAGPNNFYAHLDDAIGPLVVGTVVLTWCWDNPIFVVEAAVETALEDHSDGSKRVKVLPDWSTRTNLTEGAETLDAAHDLVLALAR